MQDRGLIPQAPGHGQLDGRPGGTSYRRFVDLRDSSRSVDHTHEVLKTLDGVQSLLADAETGQRGFLITGASSYLDPYRAALAALPPRLEELRTLTADNPRQQSHLAALDALIREKLTELNATIVVRETRGLEAAARIVQTDKGKHVMDRIRTVVEAMRAEERRLLSERLEHEEGAARAAVLTTVSGLILALLLVAIATVLLNHAVRERGRADAARGVAEATARAVAESEERLRITLASIGDAVIATDAEGRVTLMNGVAEALTGWTTAEWTGRPLDDVFVLVNEESRRPVESPVGKVLREGVIAGLANHTVLRSKDGREIPIDDSAAPIGTADGHLLGVVMVFRDVTERREAERDRAALLQKERTARAEVERVAQRLRHIQAVTDTALANLGSDALMRALLPRVRLALGSDTATILLFEPETRDLVPVASEGLQEEIDEGVRIPVGQGVAGRIAASGHGLVIDDLTAVEVASLRLSEKVKSLVGAPLRIENRLIGVIHAGSATPRRFAEADLELLCLVAERVGLAVEGARVHEAERAARAVAEEAQREAETANRMKDQFLAVLSHELRTPLTTMVGWVSMLRRARLDPAQEQPSIAAGTMTLDRRPMSLGPLVAETVESLQHEAKGKGLTLETHLDPAAGAVSADADRMRQILSNLLVNAIKYTPSAGSVTVRLTSDDGAVRIVVQDTGRGIDRELLPHVFERFRQADVRAAGTQGGLGLGLAIVRELVEMHGGAVTAASDGAGRGSEFVVTLAVIRSG